MTITERLKIAYRAFKAAPSLWVRGEYGVDAPPPPTFGDYLTTSAAVYRCIMLRATNMARPTMRVYRTSKGQYEELYGHPLGKLMQKVNPFWTGKQLWRATEADLCWYGNAYWALEGGDGAPSEIWRMRPDWVRIVPHKIDYITGYLYTVDGIEYPWAADRVIHFRYTNPFNEFYGMAPARAAMYSIEMGIEGIKYNRYFFKNMAMPAMTLWTEQPMNNDTAMDLLKRWNEALQGPLKAGKTAILHSGLKPAPLTVNQKDAEWLSALKWSLEDTARVYGVPAPLVGEERAVYKNIVEAEAALWHETLIPEIDWMTDIINVGLATKFYGPDIVLEPDLSAVEALQDDMLNLTTRYGTLLEKAAATINETRAKLHLGADVPWGKMAWIGMQYMPVSSVGSNPDEAKSAKADGGVTSQTGGEQTPPKQGTTARKPRVSHAERGFLDELPDVADDITDTLATFVGEFLRREAPRVAETVVVEKRQVTGGYDWDVWQRDLTPGMVEATAEQCADALQAVYEKLVGGSFDLANPRAKAWAIKNAGLQITNITAATKQGIAAIIAQATEEGWARDRIRDAIMTSPLFDAKRGRLVARTETERAYNQGNLQGYRESGVVDGKGWIGAADCCDECVVNEAQGFIGLEADFASGDDAPPAHPKCRCRIIPRIKPPNE